MRKQLKVLIVDDSSSFRAILQQILKDIKNIEIVGSVESGNEALEFIKSNETDLVTLDFEMPGMDGLETLKEIQKINASRNNNEMIGVIMISSFTSEGADITIKALEIGAFDFVAKPASKIGQQFLQQKIISKVQLFSTKRICSQTLSRVPDKIISAAPKPVVERKPLNGVRAILIGVSTGGPKALIEMLPELSEKVKLPIFIVQHMPPVFTESLAKNLNSKCRHNVIECKANDVVKDDYVYIAPGGKHMSLKKSDQNVMTVIREDPPENGCRPSVDFFFRAAGDIFGGNVLSIILTGMGNDGTKGLQLLKQKGAYVIAQDEKTSVVWGMPGSAVKAGVVDEELPITEISETVSFLVNG